MYITVSLAELQVRAHAAGCPWLVLLLPVDDVGVSDTHFLLLGFQRLGAFGAVP